MECVFVSFVNGVPKFRTIEYSLNIVGHNFEIVGVQANDGNAYPFCIPIGYKDSVVKSLKNPNSPLWQIKQKRSIDLLN